MFYASGLIVYLGLLLEGEPIFLLVNGMLLPPVVLLTSYIKVGVDEGSFGRKRKMALVLMLTSLAAILVVGAIRTRSGLRAEVLLCSVIAHILGGLFLFHPSITGLFRRKLIVPFRGAYLGSAALLLLVLTLIPAASFFKLACDVPIENMIKNGQLKLMRQMKLKDPPSLAYAGVFFLTSLDPGNCLEARQVGRPRAGEKSPRAIRKASLRAVRASSSPATLEIPQESPHIQQLLDLQEGFFPIYSEGSSDLARLAPDKAEWSWTWQHLRIKRPDWKNLHGMLRLHREADAQGPALHLTSRFPAVGPEGGDWITLVFGVLAMCAASLGLVWLMADNLMLLRASSPYWLNRRRLSLYTSTGNLICVSRRPDRLRGIKRPGAGIIDLVAAEDDVLTGRILEAPALQRGRLIVVKGFEHRIEDRGFNWAKLELLEALTGERGRRVVVLSEQDPHLHLAWGELCGGGEDPKSDQEEQERWQRLLARFTTVDLDVRSRDTGELLKKLNRVRNRLLRMGGKSRIERLSWRRHVDSCLRILRAECDPTPQLVEIGLDVLSDLGPEDLERARILDEIRARAEGYYRNLWDSMSDEERVVLLQLADEGLANPKSLRTLEKLIARGILFRDPAPRLMNETFRQFIVRFAPRETVEEMEATFERESTWGRLKGPLAAGMTAAILFIGFTQRDMFNTTFALISTFAGGLPHLLQLVGYFGASKIALPHTR